MVLFPKLTKVDKGKVCLSLLDGRRAASADSVQMQILYSPRKGVQSCLHNNIITMYFCRFSELDDTYVGHRRLLCRGGAGPHGVVLYFPPSGPAPWAADIISSGGKIPSPELHWYWYCLNAKKIFVYP